MTWTGITQKDICAADRPLHPHLPIGKRGGGAVLGGGPALPSTWLPAGGTEPTAAVHGWV